MKRLNFSRKTRPTCRLTLQALEDRAVPATFTVANTNDDGVGSLRAAVATANTTPGADTITFTINVDTISLTTGEIGINDAVTISGPGALAVTANHLSRVFDTVGAPAGTPISISG